MSGYEISEGMDVFGSDGERVGTVEGGEGQRIRLKDSGPDRTGCRGFISVDMVEETTTHEIRLLVSSTEALSMLESEVAGTAAAGA